MSLEKSPGPQTCAEYTHTGRGEGPRRPTGVPSRPVPTDIRPPTPPVDTLVDGDPSDVVPHAVGPRRPRTFENLGSSGGWPRAGSGTSYDSEGPGDDLSSPTSFSGGLYGPGVGDVHPPY